MPLSTAAKAALCLCPPAAMVGAVATVPAARRVAHHLTAPHHARPVHRVLTAAAAPPAEPARAADCPPVAAGPLPAVPVVTYAAPIPDEPGGTGANVGPVAGGSGLATQAPIAIGGLAASTSSTGETTPAVPEPATWALVIVGAGAVGATLRRRRRPAAGSGRRGALAGGIASWGIGGAAEAGDLAVSTSVAAKSTLASVTGKALLCACPAAVVAGSVVGVPPLRHAVHAATAPAPVPAAAPIVRSTAPCAPVATVPVSATAVADFPDTVSTAAPSA